MDLSVIIVNYNVKFFLEQCLKSVFRSGKDLDMEVIVVDNNSVDGSVNMIKEKFPQVKLIANKENTGFSKANNQGINISSGKYVLILNPDTIVEDDTLPKVVKFMDENPDAGGLGVKMLDGNGRFLPESKRSLPTPAVAFYKIFGLSSLFPKSKIFGKYHLGYLDNNKTHQVEILPGAFMLVRRKVLDEIGYLDEDFFMYGEDIDLSWRIIKAGYKNYYFPETRIIHYKGESTKKSSINYVIVFYKAMVIFARKHFSNKNIRLFSFLINFAVWFRASLAILNRFVKKAFWPVLDILLIFTGFVFIKNYWEQHVHLAEGDYYPIEYLLYAVPAYILIWIFATYFNGGYDKPVKLFRIVRGIGVGTIIILVIYALLPTSLRFSRALILLGGLWALISMLATRTIAHLIQHKDLSIGQEKPKRIIIVGEGEEAKRIAALARQSGHCSFIGLIGNSNGKYENGYVGKIDQIDEIVEIYKIDDIIFCASTMSSQKIMDLMLTLKKHQVNFKIAPPDSSFVIGSNSIDTFSDLFTININGINKPSNKRNKRLFDLFIAGLLLVSLPFTIFFVNNKWGFVKNIFSVIFNKKTWVGYHPGHSYTLPKLKKPVLYTSDIFSHKNLNNETCANLDTLYARDYKIENDLSIVSKGFKYLGRKK